MKKLLEKIFPDWETTVGVGILVLIIALILSAIFTIKILCFVIIIGFGVVTVLSGIKTVLKFMDWEIWGGIGMVFVTLGLLSGTILLWPTWMS